MINTLLFLITMEMYKWRVKEQGGGEALIFVCLCVYLLVSQYSDTVLPPPQVSPTTRPYPLLSPPLFEILVQLLHMNYI